MYLVTYDIGNSFIKATLTKINTIVHDNNSSDDDEEEKKKFKTNCR